MRARLIMAAAVVALGFGFSQPAAAGGWHDGDCCSGSVYVHHHVYYPPRFRHIYHVHTPGPLHVNVVHYPYAFGCCGSLYAYRSWDYVAPPRYRWYWRGRHW
jgi:hypothetical protein